MSPVPFILGLSIGLGLVMKGSMRHLERVRLHWWAFALLGLGLQILPVPQLPGLTNRGTGAVLLLASYASLLTFLALNRRIPGATMMAVGLILNMAVVSVNAGMPVSAEAAELAGGQGPAPLERGSKHHLMTDGDSLRFLGDVIPIPPPFGVVISIGDVFLYAGLGLFAFGVTRGRKVSNPRPLAMWFMTYRGKHTPEHWRLAARSRINPHAGAAQSGTGP